MGQSWQLFYFNSFNQYYTERLICRVQWDSNLDHQNRRSARCLKDHHGPSNLGGITGSLDVNKNNPIANGL